MERLIINAKGNEKVVRGTPDPKYKDKKIIPDTRDIFLTNMIAEQRMRREFDPSQKEAKVSIQTRLPWVAVLFTGDWHIGSERTDYVLWDKHMNMVADTEGMYMCVVGDERDNFVIPKYATGRDEHLINPHQQADFVEWHLKKMDEAGKIIARTGGNHDGWTWMMSGIHLEHMWYRDLQSPLLENGGFVHLNLNDNVEYVIYLHHGITRFNSSFNPNHATKRAFEFQGPFDIGAMGHVHQTETAHSFRWNDRYAKDYIQVRTGTYKINDEYARSKQLGRGQPPGTCVLLSTVERNMIPIVDMENTVEVMEALNGKKRTK